MACEVLDIRCIFMNELIGNAMLAMIFVAILYFIIASKIRLGFDTTIAMAIPLLLITGLAFSGFSAIYAFSTLLVGLMVAWVFQRVIRN